MKNEIFNFNGTPVNVIIDEQNNPYWIAKEVCDVLSISNSRDAVARLDEDEKRTVVISDGTSGNPNKTIINESGLYSLILRSNKLEAKAFKKWVTSDILPSIRRNGMYVTTHTAEKILNNPDFLIETLTQLKREREEKAELQYEIKQLEPKRIFADAVSASKTSILVGELAKILKQNGVEIGQQRLFEWLREKGYLIKRRGTDYNMPTQRSMELGLFEIKETAVTHSDGHVTVSKTPKVTGKGQEYFINKFLGNDRAA